MSQGHAVIGAGRPPEQPQVRLIERHASLQSRALAGLLRLLRGPPLSHARDIVGRRQHYEMLDARHVHLHPSERRKRVDCDGVAADWIEVPESQPGRALLLLHGGSFAFRFPNLYAVFAARLCRRLGACALVPDYRLLPEHRYPAAPDDCETAYRWLLAEGHAPTNVVIVGQSAGGNLALVTMHRCQRARVPQPACALLLSPAVDCTLASPSLFENERDPVVTLADLVLLRDHYVPSAHLYTDPDVSPLFADFVGYPPLLLQVGHFELLRDESVRVAAKAQAAGVTVELELWPDTLHGFQVASFLPEAGVALERMALFVQAHTGWSR